jgi:hypothetical protein
MVSPAKRPGALRVPMYQAHLKIQLSQEIMLVSLVGAKIEEQRRRRLSVLWVKDGMENPSYT